jgi:hypothetical protein
MWQCLKVVVRATLSVMISLKRETMLPYVFRGALMSHIRLSKQMESNYLVVKQPLPWSANILAVLNILSSSKFAASMWGFSATGIGVFPITSS